MFTLAPPQMTAEEFHTKRKSLPLMVSIDFHGNIESVWKQSLEGVLSTTTESSPERQHASIDPSVLDPNNSLKQVSWPQRTSKLPEKSKVKLPAPRPPKSGRPEVKDILFLDQEDPVDTLFWEILKFCSNFGLCNDWCVLFGSLRGYSINSEQKSAFCEMEDLGDTSSLTDKKFAQYVENVRNNKIVALKKKFKKIFHLKKKSFSGDKALKWVLGADFDESFPCRFGVEFPDLNDKYFTTKLLVTAALSPRFSARFCAYVLENETFLDSTRYQAVNRTGDDFKTHYLSFVKKILQLHCTGHSRIVTKMLSKYNQIKDIVAEVQAAVESTTRKPLQADPKVLNRLRLDKGYLEILENHFGKELWYQQYKTNLGLGVQTGGAANTP